MCMICDRIKMIKQGTNPWFVKELETGYVVIGDNQHFNGYTLFLCKEDKTELFQLDYPAKNEISIRNVRCCRSRSKSVQRRKNEL